MNLPHDGFWCPEGISFLRTVFSVTFTKLFWGITHEVIRKLWLDLTGISVSVTHEESVTTIPVSPCFHVWKRLNKHNYDKLFKQHSYRDDSVPSFLIIISSCHCTEMTLGQLGLCVPKNMVQTLCIEYWVLYSSGSPSAPGFLFTFSLDVALFISSCVISWVIILLWCKKSDTAADSGVEHITLCNIFQRIFLCFPTYDASSWSGGVSLV